jgi:hypothetical protein
MPGVFSKAMLDTGNLFLKLCLLSAFIKSWVWIRKDPHQIERYAPDPHPSDKLDPDPDQRNRLDPVSDLDPH